MLDWDPKGGTRGVGRPLARWEDSLIEFAKAKGQDWRNLAEDRVMCQALRLSTLHSRTKTLEAGSRSARLGENSGLIADFLISRMV